MPSGSRTMHTHWQDWITLLLGMWLIASPWILGYAGQPSPAWNSWILGATVVIVSAAALVRFAEWEEWVNAILGLWLVVSPWVMAFAQSNRAALWNALLSGLVIGGLALWDALENRETAVGA